jgi:hypothetical protein
MKNKRTAATPAKATRLAADSPLSGFVANVGLVDDVYASLAADQTIAAVTLFQGFEGVADFHGLGVADQKYRRRRTIGR